MAEKKGIPPDIVKDLDIGEKVEKKPLEVTLVVENHQAKIPIPKRIRLKMNLKKGDTCKMEYNENKKELICKF